MRNNASFLNAQNSNVLNPAFQTTVANSDAHQIQNNFPSHPTQRPFADQALTEAPAAQVLDVFGGQQGGSLLDAVQKELNVFASGQSNPTPIFDVVLVKDLIKTADNWNQSPGAFLERLQNAAGGAGSPAFAKLQATMAAIGAIPVQSQSNPSFL